MFCEFWCQFCTDFYISISQLLTSMWVARCFLVLHNYGCLIGNIWCRWGWRWSSCACLVFGHGVRALYTCNDIILQLSDVKYAVWTAQCSVPDCPVFSLDMPHSCSHWNSIVKIICIYIFMTPVRVIKFVCTSLESWFFIRPNDLCIT